jgi:hypothetical protein
MVAAAAATVLAAAGCGETPQPARPPAPTFAPLGSVTCSEQAYAAKAPRQGWVHPQQNYYAPGQQPMPSDIDLQHLLIQDDSVIVRYARGAAEADRAALRDWAATQTSVVVAPATAPDPAPVEAFRVDRQLTCDGADPQQLSDFAGGRGAIEPQFHDESG